MLLRSSCCAHAKDQLAWIAKERFGTRGLNFTAPQVTAAWDPDGGPQCLLGLEDGAVVVTSVDGAAVQVCTTVPGPRADPQLPRPASPNAECVLLHSCQRQALRFPIYRPLRSGLRHAWSGNTASARPYG